MSRIILSNNVSAPATPSGTDSMIYPRGGIWYQMGSDGVEHQLGSVTDAADVGIADAGNHYSGVTVEAALQELGAGLAGANTGQYTAMVAVSASGTIAASTHTEAADSSAGVITRTLLTAVGRSGKRYTIIKVDASTNYVAIGTTSSQTIQGAAPPWNIRYQYESLTVEPDGSNWKIVESRVFQNLTDLRDVDAPSPTDGDALIYDDSAEEWIPGTPTSATVISHPTPQTLSATGAVDMTKDLVLVTGTTTAQIGTVVGRPGKEMTFKNIGTGIMTLDPNGSETIDGQTTIATAVQYDVCTIRSDGANWIITSPPTGYYE